MLFSVKNVSKAFKDNKVLKKVDLDVNKGDVVVILGPSGSGKTTLLRCIDFLEKADGGTFTLNYYWQSEYEEAGIKDPEIIQIAISRLKGNNTFSVEPAPWIITGCKEAIEEE